MRKKVLLVGWRPAVVNVEKWPHVTPEKLVQSQRGSFT